MSGITQNVSCDWNITFCYNWSRTRNKSQAETTEDHLKWPEETKILLVLVCCILFLVGLLGNSLVCFIIGRKRKLSGGDAFMLSLAVADLLATIGPFLVIYELMFSCSMKTGVCEVLSSIFEASIIASSWSLVLIAADRYRVIVHPMKSRLSCKMKCTGITLAWSLAAGITMPYIVGFGPALIAAYPVTLLSIYCFIPLIIISILYSICALKLRENRFGNDMNESQKRRILQNKKAVKMFVIIVCLFYICSLPFTLYGIILMYKEYNIDLHFALFFCTLLMTDMNSCINPFIYAKMHQEINAFLNNAWKEHCCKATSHFKTVSCGKNAFNVHKRNAEIAAEIGVHNQDIFEGPFTSIALPDDWICETSA